MKPEPAELLLVEDDVALAELICDELEIEGYQVCVVHSLDDARTRLKKSLPDLLVCDLHLPDGNGMSLIEEMIAWDDDAQKPALMVITAFGSVRQAVSALQAGADDFLTKPLDMEHFRIAVRRVLETRRLKSEVLRFRSINEHGDFHGLLGKSKVMQALKEQICTVAHANGPVLVLGESGSGKELVARAIHAESDRSSAPFLAVNCAGIPRELLESEFFGHRQGAFSGASSARNGLLQEADGGTLMLDEIGEMPQELQAKLLRALQDGSIRPVGQDSEVTVDVRIIASTHQNLQQRVVEGVFRQDLYYRLETFTLLVPPLRAREEDIPFLARRFLAGFALEQSKDVRRYSPEAMARLCDYGYPGNVRELRNVVERAVAYCKQPEVRVEDLPERILSCRRGSSSVRNEAGRATAEDESLLLQGDVLPSLDELQRRYARLVLGRVGGNKQRAAALLGIGRRTLYRWLEGHAL
jgi:DNA-binding NtrC family response regulator